MTLSSGPHLSLLEIEEIMCESFGHCARNAFIDDAVRLLVQQMSLGTNKIGATIVLLLVR